jgi:CubicO group peptidase (beta-lactamase class C family)
MRRLCYFIAILAGSVVLCATDAARGEMSAAERAAAYAQLSPVADRFVLDDETLPTFDFAEPAMARELIGDYRLQAVVYDAKYRLVTKASEPGRYGAVVEIIPGADRQLPSSRRFLTLFRSPMPGVNPKSTLQHARELAARHEVPPADDPANFYHGAVEKDRLWWIGLKRRLYGFDKLYPEPFRSPLPIEGAPAPVVREGTLAEAGMKPGTDKRLDELLTAWATDSDTGFDVCIVRHGVIVLHKAYGQRRGQPITADTTTPLTSTSKMITATMLMQLVDQGWLTMDGSIAELPGPLHHLKTQRPVTLRAMYTHTAFIGGLNPDPDMAERLALVLPHLEINRSYTYTGTSLEMAWEFAQLATGESISTFARDHLLRPLGCNRTQVFNTGGSTESTSKDMARICQMLLNRGAYGDKRYFSGQTFAEMLPRRLTKTLGPYTNDRVWGMGTHPATYFWKVEGLSDFAFGHGGVFRSTDIIDPLNDLIIVMLRIGEGTNYSKYHPQFLKLIVESLEDRLPSFPQALTLAGLDIPAGGERLEVEAFVENPGPAAVLEYRYRTAGTSWQISPAEARIELPAKSRMPIRVEARFDPQNPSPLPMLEGQIYAAAGPTPPGTPIEYWLRPLVRRSTIAHRLAKVPKIDGKLESGEFGNIHDVELLLETHGRKRPQNQTQFSTFYDGQALYVTVTAEEKNPRSIPQTTKAKDDPAIKNEDYIEVAIDLVGDGKPPRQFAVNLDGLQYDALGGDAAWNADWAAKVGSGDQYVVEFAIPFAALGVAKPKPGDEWRLNVLRGRSRGPNDKKWELFSQWVMTYGDFNSATHLGLLRFE